MFNLHTCTHTHMHTLGHNAFLTVDPVQKLCASHWLVQIPTFPSTFYAASSEKETSRSFLSLLETFLSSPGPGRTGGRCCCGPEAIWMCPHRPCRGRGWDWGRSLVPQERPGQVLHADCCLTRVLQSEELPRESPWQPPREDGDHLILDIT